MKTMAFLLGATFLAFPAFAAQVPSMTETELAAKGFLVEGAEIGNCTGAVGVLRFSEPKEGGSFAGFKHAVAQHRTWLHGKGFEDVTFAVHRSRMGRGGQVGFGSLITYPTAARYAEVGAARADTRDEAYTAFVSEYKAHTDGYVTVTLCLKDPGTVEEAGSPAVEPAGPGD